MRRNDRTPSTVHRATSARRNCRLRTSGAPRDPASFATTDHDQGPHQVELLFDRERPHVPQRAHRRLQELVDVRLPRRDEVPVRDVPERRQPVDGEALAVDLIVEQQRVDADDREEQQQRGHEAARPPRPERPERDRVRPAPLVDEQARDQEAAEDEEEVDAEEPARRDVGREVVQDHGEHGQAAQPVERAKVREPRSASLTGLIGGGTSRCGGIRLGGRVRPATTGQRRVGDRASVPEGLPAASTRLRGPSGVQTRRSMTWSIARVRIATSSGSIAGNIAIRS